MQLDLTKLAALVRTAHVQGKSMRLPAMTVRELGQLANLLSDPRPSTSTSSITHH
tara:strand:- start:128638 stop:128802 length:165 start_codon:yes stop_codon:yes gene_type:complete